MTPFASVALYRRDGSIVFRAPRKERPDHTTQARKAAMRFWSGRAVNGDKLVKVIVIREYAGRLEIAERGPDDAAWKSYTAEIAVAAKEPHIASAIAELGIDAGDVPAPVPDVLIINGFTYRRDI
jgi:hypothetical protein